MSWWISHVLFVQNCKCPGSSEPTLTTKCKVGLHNFVDPSSFFREDLLRPTVNYNFRYFVILTFYPPG